MANGKKRGRKGASYSLKSATYAIGKNYSELFKQIEAPVLIIHANKDNLFKQYCAQYLLDLLPDSQMKNVIGYHDWAMYEQKDLVKMITNFLRDKS